MGLKHRLKRRALALVTGQADPSMRSWSKKAVRLWEKYCDYATPYGGPCYAEAGPSKELDAAGCEAVVPTVAGFAAVLVGLRDSLLSSANSAMLAGASYDEPVRLLNEVDSLARGMNAIVSQMQAVIDYVPAPAETYVRTFYGWPTCLLGTIDRVERAIGVLAGDADYDSTVAGLTRLRDEMRSAVEGGEAEAVDGETETVEGQKTAGSAVRTKDDVGFDWAALQDEVDDLGGLEETLPDEARQSLVDAVEAFGEAIDAADSTGVQDGLKALSDVVNGSSEWPEEFEEAATQLEDAFYAIKDVCRSGGVTLSAEDVVETKSALTADELLTKANNLRADYQTAYDGEGNKELLQPLIDALDDIVAALEDGDVEQALAIADATYESEEPGGSWVSLQVELQDFVEENGDVRPDDEPMSARSTGTKSGDSADAVAILREIGDLDLADSLEEAIDSGDISGVADVLADVDLSASEDTENAEAWARVQEILDGWLAAHGKTAVSTVTKSPTDPVGSLLDQAMDALAAADESDLCDELSMLMDDLADAKAGDPDAVAQAIDDLENFQERVKEANGDAGTDEAANNHLTDAVSALDEAISTLQSASGVMDDRDGTDATATKRLDTDVSQAVNELWGELNRYLNDNSPDGSGPGRLSQDTWDAVNDAMQLMASSYSAKSDQELIDDYVQPCLDALNEAASDYPGLRGLAAVIGTAEAIVEMEPSDVTDDGSMRSAASAVRTKASTEVGSALEHLAGLVDDVFNVEDPEASGVGINAFDDAMKVMNDVTDAIESGDYDAALDALGDMPPDDQVDEACDELAEAIEALAGSEAKTLTVIWTRRSNVKTKVSADVIATVLQAFGDLEEAIDGVEDDLLAGELRDLSETAKEAVRGSDFDDAYSALDGFTTDGRIDDVVRDAIYTARDAVGEASGEVEEEGRDRSERSTGRRLRTKAARPSMLEAEEDVDKAATLIQKATAASQAASQALRQVGGGETADLADRLLDEVVSPLQDAQASADDVAAATGDLVGADPVGVADGAGGDVGDLGADAEEGD